MPKPNLMPIAWGIVGMVFLLSCADRAATATSAEPAPEWPEAPLEVLEAEVVGDELHLLVSYGGGCAEHLLEVASAGPLLKSMPPKQPLRLVHRTPGDPCRALIQRELFFDLKPWRGTPHGVTVILLENWNEALPYEYD